MLHPGIARITDRTIAALAREPPALSRPARRRGRGRPGARPSRLLGAGACLCRRRARTRTRLAEGATPNIGIVTTYNDMLSAHQPFERFPPLIRAAARAAGGTAQVAGGVPAMCDGVTQGYAGMELSLFSRDVIALAAGVALSATTPSTRRSTSASATRSCPDWSSPPPPSAISPASSCPPGRCPRASPTTKRPRSASACHRRGQPRRADGGRDGRLSRARHLHLLRHRQHQPDADGVHGPAPARRQLRQPEHAVARRADRGGDPAGAGDHRARQRLSPRSGEVLDEKAFVNGMVGLMATGGSTNLVLHLPAMARAAGILLLPDDFAEVSDSGAADGQGLSQRPGRREPFPRRRRPRPT